MIAIIPTDSESLTNDLTSKNSCINVNSKLLPTSTDSKVADSNKGGLLLLKLVYNKVKQHNLLKIMEYV